MDVGYKAIRETFTSRVTLDPEALTVRSGLVDGPFRTLENRWSFAPAAGGADVRFFITYEFKSMLLQMLVGAMFEQAFRRFAGGLRGARASGLRQRTERRRVSRPNPGLGL